MLAQLRFLRLATRRHRLRPWRSPYLRWRIETYSGRPAETIGMLAFFAFLWRERRRLPAFLAWCGQMRRYRRMARHPWRSAFAGPKD